MISGCIEKSPPFCACKNLLKSWMSDQNLNFLNLNLKFYLWWIFRINDLDRSLQQEKSKCDEDFFVSILMKIDAKFHSGTFYTIIKTKFKFKILSCFKVHKSIFIGSLLLTMTTKKLYTTIMVFSWCTCLTYNYQKIRYLVQNQNFECYQNHLFYFHHLSLLKRHWKYPRQ